MAVALYPGAFKPPHRGHFEVAKSLATNQLSGKVYDLSNYKEKANQILQKDFDKLESIEKVVVFIGSQVRNGITQEDSRKIWNIYGEHIPAGKLEIYSDINDPLKASKAYARENPKTTFYSITGVRSEEDIPDLRRVGAFKNIPNVKGLAMGSAPGEAFRGTDFRKAFLSGNLDDIIDFFPKELSKDDMSNIISMIKSKIVAEEINQILENKLNERFENITYKEGKFNYVDYMASILESMVEMGHNIMPLPNIKLNKSEDDTFFRPTAHYLPEEQELTLYVGGRHPKDIMRSFCHEMIHHKQNLEGRLSEVSTSNVNEDDKLEELEKEAYLEGNMAFRKWEDSIKSR